MRPPLPILLLVVGAGCADVLGIEPWDASLGAGGGSTSTGAGPTGTAGETASSTGSSPTSTSSGDGGSGAGASGSSGPGGGGQGGAGCGLGEERCGEACVDLVADPAHCGACDHGCFGGTCVDAVCSAVVVGAVDDPQSLAATPGAVWLLDRIASGAHQIERVDLSGAGAAPAPMILRHTLPASFAPLLGVGAADALGFYFAGYEDETEKVMRFLDGASTVVALGETTFPLSFDVSSMEPSDGSLWISGRLVDASVDPPFGQAGVYSLALGASGQVPVPRCVRTGVNAPLATDVAALAQGVAYGRTLHGGAGPDLLTCGVDQESLLTTSPMSVNPRDVIADASHVYFATLDTIYRVPRTGAMPPPEPWVATGEIASYLADAGDHVVWREGTKVVRRPKPAAAGEPVVVLDAGGASHVAVAGDVVAWVRYTPRELVIQRLPAGE